MFLNTQEFDSTKLTQSADASDFISLFLGNEDFRNNALPLTTTLLQLVTNYLNHLQDVNLSHNAISSLPDYVPLPACIQNFDLSYNGLSSLAPLVYF